MSDLPPPSAPRHGHPLDPSRRQLLQAILALPFATAVARAAAPAVGKPAPRFRLQDQTGRWITLDAQRGKWVVLYFYPKDDTPGCTKEACTFRDQFEAFTRAGAEVIGVSSDDGASHRAFAKRHRLPFTLLSDAGGVVRKRYGIPATLGLLPGRVSFVIDRNGVVRHVFSSQLAAAQHVREALEALHELEGEPAS